jgi:Spy/CpxP family protein refolding chaperone
MKKFLLMCCFLMGIAAVSHAQGGGGMRKSPEDRAKDLKAQLSLTDEQTAKVTAIYKEQAAKMDSVRTAANGDRSAMRTAMMPMMKATNDKIKAVLTTDQAAAYEKAQKERMEKMRQGGGQGGGGGSQN